MTMSVSEAGRLGGLSLSRKRGRDHFSKIGKKGQQSMRKRYPGKASAWGRLGGRPKKLSLKDVGEVNNNKKEDADPPDCIFASPIHYIY